MNKEHDSISGTKDEEKLKQVMLKTKKKSERISTNNEISITSLNRKSWKYLGETAIMMT